MAPDGTVFWVERDRGQMARRRRKERDRSRRKELAFRRSWAASPGSAPPLRVVNTATTCSPLSIRRQARARLRATQGRRQSTIRRASPPRRSADCTSPTRATTGLFSEYGVSCGVRRQQGSELALVKKPRSRSTPPGASRARESGPGHSVYDRNGKQLAPHAAGGGRGRALESDRVDRMGALSPTAQQQHHRARLGKGVALRDSAARPRPQPVHRIAALAIAGRDLAVAGVGNKTEFFRVPEAPAATGRAHAERAPRAVTAVECGASTPSSRATCSAWTAQGPRWPDAAGKVKPRSPASSSGRSAPRSTRARSRSSTATASRSSPTTAPPSSRWPRRLARRQFSDVSGLHLADYLYVADTGSGADLPATASW